MDSTNNQIEEIKNKLDIVQVIEKYVKLRQAGKNFSGLCPFHNEKTPSFIVSPDLQRYKCFGCGETGDIYNFVQKIENIDFPEALEKLAKQAGVELKRQKPNSRFKTLEDINYTATKYYYNELKLKKNKHALQYLLDRGINMDSIKAFGVGYSPRTPNLKEFLFKIKKYTNKELIDSGLFVLKENKLKEKFYDRIMFPIRSKRGTVLGFTARILPENKWGPKYMNSPDTAIFHKKENVYGQYESRQEIRKNDLAIICEGSTDVISAHQHGIKNIVAPLGTGLTKEQLQNLSSLTKNFLFFFDSDEAGNSALIRAFKIASELQLNPYATTAKPYKDIDELLQKESKKMGSLIKNKREAFSFILSNFMEDKNINKLEDLNRIKDFVSSLLSSVLDKSTKHHYINKTSALVKVDILEPNTTALQKQDKKSGCNHIRVKSKIHPLEKTYLKLFLLLDEGHKAHFVPLEYFSSIDYKKLYNPITTTKWDNKDKLYALLRSKEDVRETFENLIFDLTDIPEKKEDIVKELETTKEKLKEKYLKEKQKELSVKIAMAEEDGNYKSSEKYMKELDEINKIMKEK